jgi:hypothetical protein
MSELPQSTVFTDLTPWSRSGVRRKLGGESCIVIGPDGYAIAFLPIGLDGHAAAIKDADAICAALNARAEAAAEVALLTEERDQQQAAAEAAEAEVKRLRDALQWYASPEAWTAAQIEGPDGDYGERAVSALKGNKP